VKRVADLDVKDPAWRDVVVAAVARGSVKGLPKPAGLPANGDLVLQQNAFGRHRVVYRMPDKTVTLGSVKDSHQQAVRQEWFRDHPITLESGRHVILTFDDGNPDLVRPWPIELFRRPTLQGA
jgi:hypothetical protein